MPRLFLFLVKVAVHAIRSLAMSRENLVLENIASRQQLTALKQDRPRPPLDDFDRGCWVALRASWSGWVNRTQCIEGSPDPGHRRPPAAHDGPGIPWSLAVWGDLKTAAQQIEHFEGAESAVAVGELRWQC